MKFGFNDTMTFGAHKGKTVKEILDKSPHWACWLREEKKKSGQATPFTKEVHDELDRLIRKSKTLQKQYQPWNLSGDSLGDVMAAAVAKAEEKEVRMKSEDEEREIAYAGEWGAW